MRIYDRPFHFGDLRPVVECISEQHRSELEGYDPVQVANALDQFIRTGVAAVTIEIDWQPAAVLFISHGHMWFLATQEYFSVVAPIRHGRRLIKRLVAEHGPLTSRTLSKHPHLDRWMRLHGGELQESTGNGLLYIFR